MLVFLFVWFKLSFNVFENLNFFHFPFLIRKKIIGKGRHSELRDKSEDKRKETATLKLMMNRYYEQVKSQTESQIFLYEYSQTQN